MFYKLVFLVAALFKLNEAQVPARFAPFTAYCMKAFNRTYPENCLDLLCKLQVEDGVYKIYPTGSAYFSEDVYCDMTSDGGGWTTFLRRLDETDQPLFSRTWKRFEIGIGKPNSNHFLGLKRIHQISNRLPNDLRIDMERWDGDKRFAHYSGFSVSNSSLNYQINFSGFTGNVQDSLAPHNGMKFSTGEKDNDLNTRTNCAEAWASGWWWNNCSKVRLLGPFLKPNQFVANQGILWYHWDGVNDGQTQSLLYADMKMRPKMNSLTTATN